MVRQGVDPERILATTFSKKAAGEMNERLKKLGCPVKKNQGPGARVGTFHSVCLEILRKDSPWAKHEIDAKDKMRLELKKILGWSPNGSTMDWKNYDLSEVESFISHCKNGLVTCDEKLPEWLTAEWRFDPRFQEAYRRYEDRREELGLITFDDMLILSVKWLQDNQDAKSFWSNKYSHVIIDEFQDSNRVQYELMKILSENSESLLVVGDDDQSIYKFRGAVPEYTVGFQSAFDADIFRMQKNYRSVPEVTEAANKLISHNENRIEKQNDPNRNSQSNPISVEIAADSDDEANRIVDHVKILIAEETYSYGDMAVLYRTNAMSRAIEEAMIREKIPHVVIGGINFYRRKEIADIIAYMRVAANHNNDKACLRAINRPFRYIGKVTLDLAEEIAHEMDCSIYEVIESHSDKLKLKGRQQQSLGDFIWLVDMLKLESHEIGLSMALSNLLEKSGYSKWICKDEGNDNAENSRLSNLRELVRTTSRFATIEAFLDYVDDLEKARKNRKNKKINMVQLMTCHRVKGLEFPVVFLAGCVEKIMPHGRTDDIEEERRLCYVAITRAMDRLFVTCPTNFQIGERNISLPPSRFLREAGLL